MYNFGYGYSPYSYYSYPDNEDIMTIVAAIFISVYAVAMIISLVIYIIQGISLYTIGKNRKMNSPFFAFIPFLNIFFLGKIADDINKTMQKKSNHGRNLIILYSVMIAALIIFSMLTVVGGMLATTFLILPAVLFFVVTFVAAVVCMVVEYVVLYIIYKEYNPSNAVLFLVLSIIFPITMPFFLLSIRNKKSGYELWLEKQRQTQAPAVEETPLEEAREQTVSE